MAAVGKSPALGKFMRGLSASLWAKKARTKANAAVAGKDDDRLRLIRAKPHIPEADAAAGIFQWLGGGNMEGKGMQDVAAKIALRARLWHFMNNSKFAVRWNIAQSFFTVVACLLFLVDAAIEGDLGYTHAPTPSPTSCKGAGCGGGPAVSGHSVHGLFGIHDAQSHVAFKESLNIVDIAIGGIFTIDYLLLWAASTDRLTYPFGFYAVVDLLTFLPGYLVYAALGGGGLQPEPGTTDAMLLDLVAFLRALRVIKLQRLMGYIVRVTTRMSLRTQGLFKIGTSMVIIVFLSGALFFLVENVFRDYFDSLSDGMDEDGTEATPISIGNSYYFILVTYCTIGYGDFSPTTRAGQAVVCGPVEILQNNTLNFSDRARLHVHSYGLDPHSC